MKILVEMVQVVLSILGAGYMFRIAILTPARERVSHRIRDVLSLSDKHGIDVDVLQARLKLSWLESLMFHSALHDLEEWGHVTRGPSIGSDDAEKAGVHLTECGRTCHSRWLREKG